MALVPAAERALRIFEAFERAGQPLTLSKLAEEIDAPISSCHNLIHTLMGGGYIFTLEAQRSFYPTRKLWNLAQAIASRDPLLDRILPTAEYLRDVTSETVVVGKRQDQTAIYLLVLEGLHTIRYVAQPGRTLPLHTSAVGKALVSTLNDADFNRWLDRDRLDQITGQSIINKTELRREIRSGKAQGYFTTHGENVADVGAIAVPISVGGETLAIAVAGPVERMSARQDDFVNKLHSAVRDLEGSRI
jgi:DNA-binding IclR family transcriptional regulator